MDADSAAHFGANASSVSVSAVVEEWYPSCCGDWGTVIDGELKGW